MHYEHRFNSVEEEKFSCFRLLTLEQFVVGLASLPFISGHETSVRGPAQTSHYEYAARNNNNKQQQRHIVMGSQMFAYSDHIVP